MVEADTKGSTVGAGMMTWDISIRICANRTDVWPLRNDSTLLAGLGSDASMTVMRKALENTHPWCWNKGHSPRGCGAMFVEAGTTPEDMEGNSDAGPMLSSDIRTPEAPALWQFPN